LPPQPLSRDLAADYPLKRGARAGQMPYVARLMGMDDATPLGDTSEHSDAERVAEPSPRGW